MIILIILNYLNNMVVFCFLGIGLWLKHHRLHKYTSLFSNLTYEDMLNLTSEILETKVLSSKFIGDWGSLSSPWYCHCADCIYCLSNISLTTPTSFRLDTIFVSLNRISPQEQERRFC